MCFQKFISYGIAVMITILWGPTAMAGKWCIRNSLYPPCRGAPGRCTINRDLSKGGFVADTAYVEKIPIFGFNKPYIESTSEVCGQSKVLGKSKILYSKILGHGEVFGKAEIKVGGHAVILDSRVYGDAQVLEYARVLFSSTIEENVTISGNATIEYSWIEDHVTLTGDIWIKNARVSGDQTLSEASTKPICSAPSIVLRHRS